MNNKLVQLKSMLREVSDINNAASVLYWDQSTYMPEGGADARGRQLSTLAGLAHEKFTSPQIGTMLEELCTLEEKEGYDSDTAALIRVTRRDYEKEVKKPADFAKRMSEQFSASYMAWAKARPENDFKSLIPHLEKNLELSRELAGCFPGHEHIADPLIDDYDFGMKVSVLRPLFAQLREELVTIVKKIKEQPKIDNSFLFKNYDADKQLTFGEAIIKDLGYDFKRGRQDKSPHPFTTNFSIDDVRITTRVREDDLTEALFSTIHEAGHAMYEQNICPDYEGLPLAEGTSAGVHESQSRLWENIVGRSKGFWRNYLPALQQQFPEQVGGINLEAFYRGINAVSPSLVRTDADEVTYNLHVMIRFELELELLEGSLQVKDLPAAWNEKYKEYLGVEPDSDIDGVMQDVHWYSGPIGGSFCGYALGNLMNAQFYDAALKVHPEIETEMEKGEFTLLFNWLKEHVYRFGSKYTPEELLQRAVGDSMKIEPFLNYIKKKYGEIYGIEL